MLLSLRKVNGAVERATQVISLKKFVMLPVVGYSTEELKKSQQQYWLQFLVAGTGEQSVNSSR